MVDNIYQIKELMIGKKIEIQRLGGDRVVGGFITKYKFLEDKLVVETVCTRYTFSIIYN